MGHNVNYIVCPRNVNRRCLVAEINEEVEHEDWMEGGHYEADQLSWHEDTVYSSHDEAMKAIGRLDNGWYDDHAVLFHDLDAVRPTKSMQSIDAQIEATKKARDEFVGAHHVRDRKSALIGCDKCGSKIARGYLRTDLCPVCGSDLRPASTLERIKGYDTKLCRLKARRLDAQKKQIARAPIKWLVKYEYHT